MLGTTGLRWSDASSQTPNLAHLSQVGAVGNVAVRAVHTTTCPVDGWLTFSAGTRAAAEPNDNECTKLPEPLNGSFAEWEHWTQTAQGGKYGAVPGALMQTLQEREVIGIGSGAAIAVADVSGQVADRWQPRAADLGTQVAEALTTQPDLVIVDLGAIGVDSTAAQVDARLGQVLTVLEGLSAEDNQPTVLIASLADRGQTPQLQVGARLPAVSGSLLEAASTRQRGLVQATDFPATVLDLLDATDERFIGSALANGAVSAAANARLADDADHAASGRALVSPFYLGLTSLLVLLLVMVWAAPQLPFTPQRLRRLAQTSALWAAAVPVSLVIANAVPWWRSPLPALTLALLATGIAALLSAAAVTGPWRRVPLGPAGAVAAVTALVIVTDVLTGGHLQVSGVVGVQPLFAGRFYGFNNSAFALTLVATLFAATAAVHRLAVTGRRRLAGAVVGVVGILLTAADGAPSLGADLGGPPALVPAFAVTALLLAGTQVNWRRMVAVLATAGLVTAAFAFIDWLRPPGDRTHLGATVQMLLDGTIWPVIDRKASATLIADSWLLTAALYTLLAVGFWFAYRRLRRAVTAPRGGRFGALTQGRTMTNLFKCAPTLLPALSGALTALAIGVLVNDSGLSILGVGLSIAVPLVVAVVATWALTSPKDGTKSSSEAKSAGEPASAAEITPQHADTSIVGDASSETTAPSAHPNFLRVHVRRRLTWVVVALLAALPTAFSPAQAAASATTADAASTTTPPPLVVVGVSGLRWSDVGTLATPSLWGLSRQGALGQLVARSVHGRACPADGWLAISAGNKAADDVMGSGCRTLEDPILTEGELTVAAWPAYVTSARQQPYEAKPGLLGDLVQSNEIQTTAIGPGAAIALADSTGVVQGTYSHLPRTQRELSTQLTAAMSTSQLLVVDAGTLRDPGYETITPLADTSPLAALVTQNPTDPIIDEPGDTATEPPGSNAILAPGRAEQARAIDERIGAVITAANQVGATVIVVSVGDSGQTSLHLAAVTGTLPGTKDSASGLITSASTRQTGLVQTADLLPTVLNALHIDRDGLELVGAAWTSVPVADSATERMNDLIDMDQQSSIITRVAGGFTTRVLMALVLVLLLLWLIATSGRGLLDTVQVYVRRHGWQVLRVTAVVVATVPVASFGAGLIPWWRSDDPRVTFWFAIGLWVAAVTALAWAGPWRRSRFGPIAVVAGVTLAVLGIDLALGGPLVVDAPWGAHRLLGARFYGASNQSFALVVTAGLIVAAILARSLLLRSHRRWAIAVVSMVALFLVVVDGSPTMGADFGGPPAIIAGFTVLIVAIAQRRIRWRLLLTVGAVSALLVLAFAWMDYLRPADERTHLGRFVATVFSGGLLAVVTRKLATNLRVLGSMRYLLPTIASAITILLLIGGPRRWKSRYVWAGELVAQERLLRPATAAIATSLAIGFAINDSGIVVPATGLTLALPLLVALIAGWKSASTGASTQTVVSDGAEPNVTKPDPEVQHPVIL